MTPDVEPPLVLPPTTVPTLADQLAWDGSKLVVTDAELLALVDRRYLSPSTAKAVRGCPARMVGERALPKQTDLFSATEKGTAAHLVLERLYGLPPALRNQDHAFLIQTNMARLEPEDGQVDYMREIGADPVRYAKWTSLVHTAWHGIFDIEDPTKVNVVAREIRLDGVLIGGVPFKGFIDRLDETDDGDLKVVDYKGLALDTPIPTPSGWTTMGALAVGDAVLGSSGRATTVTVKSGVHHRPCYRLTFLDGTSVVCDNVHLWTIRESTGHGPGVRATVEADELYARYCRLSAAGRPAALTIPNAKPSGLPGAGQPIVITAMEPVESVPTQCIQVDASDSLYLCGPGMIPTHNTGKDKSRPNPKFDDEHGDQVRLYVAGVHEKLDRKPKLGYLHYIEHGKTRRVAVSDTEVKKTVRAFAASWDLLRGSVESQRFAARPSALCGWCPLVNACPVARPATNPADPRDDAATADELGIPTAPKNSTDRGSAAHGKGVGNTADEETKTTETTDMAESTWREPNKPWETDGGRIDGHLALSTPHAIATIGIAEIAAEELHKGNQKLAPVPLRALTGLLGGVVLDIQSKVTHGSTDWGEGSNTRARGALRTVLEAIPLPFGEPTEAWTVWRVRAVNFGVAMIAAGIDLFEGSLATDDYGPLTAAAPADTQSRAA